VGAVLDHVIPIFLANLHTDKDAEIRNKFFILLSRLVLDADRTVNSTNRYIFCRRLSKAD
jgi:dynein assembly factor 5